GRRPGRQDHRLLQGDGHPAAHPGPHVRDGPPAADRDSDALSRPAHDGAALKGSQKEPDASRSKLRKDQVPHAGRLSMKVVIHDRTAELAAPLRAYTEKRLSRLSRHFERVLEADVLFSENGRHSQEPERAVKITVRMDGR